MKIEFSSSATRTKKTKSERKLEQITGAVNRFKSAENKRFVKQIGRSIGRTAEKVIRGYNKPKSSLVKLTNQLTRALSKKPKANYFDRVLANTGKKTFTGKTKIDVKAAKEKIKQEILKAGGTHKQVKFTHKTLDQHIKNQVKWGRFQKSLLTGTHADKKWTKTVDRTEKEVAKQAAKNRADRVPEKLTSNSVRTATKQQPELKTLPREQEQKTNQLGRLKEARTIAKSQSKVTPKTEESYKVLSDRLRASGKSIEELAGTRKSFYSYRAAESHIRKQEIKELSKSLDSAMKSKTWSEVDRIDAKLKGHVEWFKKYPVGEGRNIDTNEKRSEFQAKQPSEFSNAKRESVSNLPTDWRDKVFNETKLNDRDSLAVVSLTGARPEELKKGVKISQEGNTFTFTIAGAKIDEKRGKGQPERTIEIDRAELQKSIEGRWILNNTKTPSKTVKLEGTPAAFSMRIHRASLRAMPNEKDSASPYTYRHAFSTRLKVASARGEISSEEISRALGHQSDRSRENYGTREQAAGAGDGGIKSATSSKPVRGR